MEYTKLPLTVIPRIKNYLIDTNGVIFGHNGLPLSPAITKSGYEVVNLSYRGYSITKQVHRLVATQFIPNPQNKETVNHKDGNKRNNHIENLEWATKKEQSQHASKVLHVINPTNKIPIMGISLLSNDILRFSSIDEASRHLNVSRGHMHSVVHGRKRSCANFIWTFLRETEQETIDLLRSMKKQFLFETHRVKQVGRFTLDGRLLNTYPNVLSTRLDGYCHQSVYECCTGKGRRKTHKGFIWKYLEDENSTMPISMEG